MYVVLRSCTYGLTPYKAVRELSTEKIIEMFAQANPRKLKLKEVENM